MSGGVSSDAGHRLGRHLSDFVGGIRQWAAAEFARRESRAEIESLERNGVLDEVLREMGMSRDDLDAIVNAGDRVPHRMEAMLAHLGLTKQYKEGVPRWAMEAPMLCRQCADTEKCDHWFKGDRKGPTDEFCPNTATFKSLLALK